MIVTLIVFEIEDVSYSRYFPSTEAQPADTLHVEFANGEDAYIPNGGFSLSNPALQFMAFVGVSPSTLDEAEGCCVPMDVLPRGEYAIHDVVYRQGSALLDAAAWGPNTSV